MTGRSETANELRDCHLSPIINQFIRAHWQSNESEDSDDERREVLEEGSELDHIWGAWEEEIEPTNNPESGIRSQPVGKEDKCTTRSAHLAPGATVRGTVNVNE